MVIPGPSKPKGSIFFKAKEREKEKPEVTKSKYPIDSTALEEKGLVLKSGFWGKEKRGPL